MAELLGGRYRVLSVVGRGGEASVLQAVDTRHDRPVALKVRPVPLDEASAELQLTEARRLLSLPAHDGLAHARDDFYEDGRHVLVLDWVDGIDLARLLSDEGSPGLPLASVLRWLAQAAEALTALHRHDVVHGDVKPANLVLDNQGRVRGRRSRVVVGARRPRPRRRHARIPRSGAGCGRTTDSRLRRVRPRRDRLRAAHRIGTGRCPARLGTAGAQQRPRARGRHPRWVVRGTRAPAGDAGRAGRTAARRRPTCPRVWSRCCSPTSSDRPSCGSGSLRRCRRCSLHELAVDAAVDQHNGVRLGATVEGDSTVSGFARADDAVRRGRRPEPPAARGRRTRRSRCAPAPRPASSPAPTGGGPPSTGRRGSVAWPGRVRCCCRRRRRGSWRPTTSPASAWWRWAPTTSTTPTTTSTTATAPAAPSPRRSSPCRPPGSTSHPIPPWRRTRGCCRSRPTTATCSSDGMTPWRPSASCWRRGGWSPSSARRGAGRARCCGRPCCRCCPGRRCARRAPTRWRHWPRPLTAWWSSTSWRSSSPPAMTPRPSAPSRTPVRARLHPRLPVLRRLGKQEPPSARSGAALADPEQVADGLVQLPQAVPVLPRPAERLGERVGAALGAVRRHQRPPQARLDGRHELVELPVGIDGRRRLGRLPHRARPHTLFDPRRPPFATRNAPNLRHPPRRPAAHHDATRS